MSEHLESLGTAVMQMLLRGDDPVLRALAAQFRECKIASQRGTGAGFFVDFSVPIHLPPVPGRDSFVFGDVVAEIDGLERGAGFLLFIKNGNLAFLEGFSYDEAWPTTVSGFKLRYSTGDERDLPTLSRQWTMVTK